MIVRITVLLIWVVLLALLFGRDYLVEELQLRESAALEKGRETSFAGVYFQNERIGFVRSRFSPLKEEANEAGLLLEQDAYLLLNILGEQHPVRMRLKAGLDSAQLLRDFDFSLISPFAETRARGVVEKGVLRLELDTPRGVRHERIPLERPPRIATSRRAYLLDQELNPGSRVRLDYFDPVSLAGQQRILEYRGREQVVINGRIYNLHRFSETYAGIRISLWLDDDGRMIKEESPAGFTFLAEPEFRATDIPRAGPEILTSVSVPLHGQLPPDIEQRSSMGYILEKGTESELDLRADLQLEGGRQQLKENTLTIQRESWPPPATASPCIPRTYQSGTHPTAGTPPSPSASRISPISEELSPAVSGALASTTHVRSDAPEIVAQAREIAAEADSAVAQVELLAAWVYHQMEKRPVLGIPDSLSILANPVGDCNEHATLFAALARSLGLPTKIAAGVVYQENAFFYHAWNEVCLDNRWYSVDTTLNQLPADLTHLRLISGETAEMIRLGGVLGNLAISIVPTR